MTTFNFTQWASISLELRNGKLSGYLIGFEGGQFTRDFQVDTFNELFEIIEKTYISEYIAKGLVKKLFNTFCH